MKPRTPYRVVAETLKSFASLAEHLLAPRRCLVCGDSEQSSLLDNSEVPILCTACKNALPLIEGELCERCGVRLISESKLCLLCREGESDLHTIRALYEYREGAISLVHGLKEAGEPRVAQFLTGEIVRREMLSSRTSLIIPIPPSRRGRRRRGFDQSLLLARALSRRTGLPVASLLSRGHGNAQKELDRQGRLSNVSAQLRLKRPGFKSAALDVPGEVTLLDDVVTTGATLEAAARLLKEAGVETIRAVVVARD